jgi:hypothetical protein
MAPKKIKIERIEGKTVFVLPENIAALLGHVVSRWANVESLLKIVLYNVVGVSDVVGRIAIGTGRANSQAVKIQELLQAHDLSMAPPLTGLINDLDKLEQRRDAFAHGVWITDPTTNELQILNISGNWNLGAGLPTVRRRLFPEGKPVTDEDLKSLIADLDKVIQDLFSLNDQALAVRQALRDRDLERIPLRHPAEDQSHKRPQGQLTPSRGSPRKKK